MTQPDSSDDITRGDEYRYPDGTVEVVFAAEGEHVLAVREYESTEAFTSAVEAAEYRGINEAVAALPPAETFAEPPFGEGPPADTAPDGDVDGGDHGGEDER